MKNIRQIGAAFALLAIFAALPGCDLLPSLGMENKINDAVPLATDLANAKKSLISELAGGQKDSFSTEWKRRMSLRALTCAKGYAPAWYSSLSTVREKLTDRSCFSEQDAETAKWIGYLRIGLELAKPPLKPLLATVPSQISVNGQVRQVSFPDKAGVVLIMTNDGAMNLVDIATSEVLRRNKAPEGSPGLISPNGKLIGFGASQYNHVSFYSTETGEEIGRVYKTREWQMHWLGANNALYTNTKSDDKTVLVNFASGNESPVPLKNISRVFPLGGQPEQFLAGSWSGVSRLELTRKDGEPSVRIIEERKFDAGRSWSRNLTDPTADGSKIYNLSASTITIQSVETLDTEAIDFGTGAGFSTIMATADPDKLLIRSNAVADASEKSPKMRDYLYSLSEKSIVQLQAPMPSRVIFARPLKANMAISDSRIDLYKPVAGDDSPITVERVASERRILEAERKIALAEQSSSTFKNTEAPLANVIGDSRVEAIGVYQGVGPRVRNGNLSTAPVIEVRIRRSDKPITLVLSSYESVRWMLIPEPGARLATVLVSGYQPSTVAGAGSTRVTLVGQKYAYDMKSNEFRELDDDIFRMAGRRISLLQGRYEGASFSVGGQL